MALPIYLAVVMSLKPVQELFVFPPKLYVIDPTLSNYSAMFRLCSDLWVPFSRYVFNSIFVTVSVTVCQVIFSAMAAFCLAKVRFPGAKAINAIIVVALLYQSNVIYIMQYMVMAKMGMIDTYWALILPSVAAPMNLFLMRQSMTQVPDAMIEAAKVDGAGMFRICWQVVMPNQKPALMTVIIFSFQAAWNIQGGTLVFSESSRPCPPWCSRQHLPVWREPAWQWRPPCSCWCRRSSSSCWHSGRSSRPWHIPESRTKGG